MSLRTDHNWPFHIQVAIITALTLAAVAIAALTVAIIETQQPH